MRALLLEEKRVWETLGSGRRLEGEMSDPNAALVEELSAKTWAMLASTRTPDDTISVFRSPVDVAQAVSIAVDMCMRLLSYCKDEGLIAEASIYAGIGKSECIHIVCVRDGSVLFRASRVEKAPISDAVSRSPIICCHLRSAWLN